LLKSTKKKPTDDQGKERKGNQFGKKICRKGRKKSRQKRNFECRGLRRDPGRIGRTLDTKYPDGQKKRNSANSDRAGKAAIEGKLARTYSEKKPK